MNKKKFIIVAGVTVGVVFISTIIYNVVSNRRYYNRSVAPIVNQGVDIDIDIPFWYYMMPRRYYSNSTIIKETVIEREVPVKYRKSKKQKASKDIKSNKVESTPSKPKLNTSKPSVKNKPKSKTSKKTSKK